MSQRFSPPASPLITVPGIAFQTGGVFLLPLVVALPTALLLQAAEVGETAGPMMLFAVAILGPVFLMQLFGLLLKSRREFAFWRKNGGLGLVRALDVLHRHLRVVTARGWVLLLAGLLTTVVALIAKWAAFGLLAVMALLLFYGVVGWTLFVSTFLTSRLERGLQRDKGSVTRKVSPAVVLVGDRAEEVFTFRRVVVPWGYYLLVDDPNPPRLGTPARHAVGAAASAGEIEQRTTLRRTPRGHWFLGPAPIWYQDVLGITRVSVVSYATAELKVLPQIPAVTVVEPPRSRLQVPDIVTKPHRFATEDHFRFREYASGDDTRRIQWRLSMRAGQLHVRLPESRETSTNQVLLVLDSFLPRGQILDASHGAEEILDALVRAWLGIAKELVERGDQVTLVAATSGETRDDITLQRLACNRAPAARWQDLGCRACWQGKWDVPAMLDAIGDDVHGVICTARFTAAPPGALPGQTLSWLFLDPADALGKADPHWTTQVIGGTGPVRVLAWIFRLPAPIASEENALLPRLRSTWQLHHTWAARAALRRAAQRRAGATRAELQRRGDSVYRIEPSPRGIRLVGLSAGASPVGGRR